MPSSVAGISGIVSAPSTTSSSVGMFVVSSILFSQLPYKTPSVTYLFSNTSNFLKNISVCGSLRSLGKYSLAQKETCQSGLMCLLAKEVGVKASWVRIPPSPQRFSEAKTLRRRASKLLCLCVRFERLFHMSFAQRKSTCRCNRRISSLINYGGVDEMGKK